MKIPEYKLTIVPQSEEASQKLGFEWAADSVGKRSRIGGRPQFLQSERSLQCPSCEGVMTFYAQVDSVGDEISLGDSGMVYVFVCFACFETKSFIQSG